MTKVTNEKLAQVIEAQHGGQAKYRQSVRLMTRAVRPNEWDGWVHIFDLKGNPNAQIAYAWSVPISGGSEPRFFAVLHSSKISDPVMAVKAAASLIQSGGR